MPLSIKNEEVERLVSELAERTGKTKTDVVKDALIAKRARTSVRVDRLERVRSFVRYLEEDVWPNIPTDELGVPLTRAEREAALGYGPEGV